MTEPKPSSDPRLPPTKEPIAETPRTFLFETLSAGEIEVLIEHAGEVYRLRRTRNGKLILNK